MVEKNITVKEFVEKYNRAKNKEAFINKHMSSTPLSVQEKIFWADKIVRTANLAEDGTYVQDSISECVLYYLTVVQLYTTIDVDFTMIDTNFDLLYNSGLLKQIYDKTPEDSDDNIPGFSLYSCVSKKSMDLRNNYCEPHAFISNQVIRFGELIGSTLGPAIENLDINKFIDGLNASIPEA